MPSIVFSFLAMKRFLLSGGFPFQQRLYFSTISSVCKSFRGKTAQFFVRKICLSLRLCPMRALWDPFTYYKSRKFFSFSFSACPAILSYREQRVLFVFGTSRRCRFYVNKRFPSPPETTRIDFPPSAGAGLAVPQEAELAGARPHRRRDRPLNADLWEALAPLELQSGHVDAGS